MIRIYIAKNFFFNLWTKELSELYKLQRHKHMLSISRNHDSLRSFMTYNDTLSKKKKIAIKTSEFTTENKDVEQNMLLPI